DAGGSNTTAWSQFDSGLRGLGQVKAGGPLLVTATAFALAGAVLLVFRRRVFAGVGGLVGGIAAGAYLTLMSAGVGDVALALFGDGLHFAIGFWLSLAAILAALTGSVFSFLAILTGAQPVPDLPGRPVISVEDPNAFNPLASKEPRPFKPDPPKDYKTFEVKGGPRTFKPRDPAESTKPAQDVKPFKGSGIGTKGEMPPTRLASPVASPSPVPWKDASQPAMKPAAPATPAAKPAAPGAPKPAAAAANPQAPVAPAAKPAVKPGAPAAKPAPKPGEARKS
ncbi:MAG TPA: hypothetical protein VM327_03560, partial [Candidatus Thermoplasmatota archaeon]|nr:hypothetical protein [Candidatus Thermoplasmatota archaeon]